MDNSTTIMIAMLFIIVIYLQMQINKLSNNENFVDTNTVTTDNLNAITNLGNLASDILNKGALTVASDLTLGGPLNLPNNVSLTSDGDWLRIRKTGTTTGDQSIYTMGLAAKDLWCQGGTLWAGTTNVGGPLNLPNGTSLTSDTDWLRVRKTGTTATDQSVYTMGLAAKDLWCGGGTLTANITNSNIINVNSLTANGDVTIKGNLRVTGNITFGTPGAEYTLMPGGDGCRIASGDANDSQRWWFQRNPGSKSLYK